MCPLMAGLVLLGVSAVVSAANGIGKGGLDLSKTREIAEDIACDMCGYIAEDLWLSLVDDWSANSTRGDLARERGMARSSRKMLEQLCTIPSPFFEQLPGMYAIKECRDGHTAEGTLCKPAALFAASTKNALQRYHVMRVPTDDNDDPVMTVGREQQLGAYKLVCQAHILPAEPDFSETIGLRFRARNTQFEQLQAAAESKSAVEDELSKADAALQRVLEVAQALVPRCAVEDKAPPDCVEKIEAASEAIIKANTTKEFTRSQIIARYKAALETRQQEISQGTPTVKQGACTEVCHDQDKTSKGAKGRREKKKEKRYERTQKKNKATKVTTAAKNRRDDL